MRRENNAVQRALILVAAIFVVGTLGYRFIEGSTWVVNPYQLGGFRLAHLVVKPTIANFFDASLGSGDLQLDQSSLRSDSPVVGRTLADADIRGQWGLSVVAVQRKGEVIPNPEPDLQLQEGDVVAVFGSRDQITRFEERCGGG